MEMGDANISMRCDKCGHTYEAVFSLEKNTTKDIPRKCCKCGKKYE